jgi:hypothetical protein
MEVIVMLITESLKTIVQRKLVMAIENTRKMIETCLDAPNLRIDDKAFTRKRTLGAKKILHLLLHRIYHSLQLCLDKYFGEIDILPVSKQAFSQSRMHLNPECVREFVDMTSELAAQDNMMPNYNGMRLIAIDGSDIALENTPELKEAFSCSGVPRRAKIGTNDTLKLPEPSKNPTRINPNDMDLPSIRHITV